MRLTDHTDYSLRVLMYLNEQKTLVTLNELSERVGVTKNNLIKVSNQLVKLEYIDSVKGRSGGHLIKPETGSKNLKDIIRSTEKSFYMAECFSDRRCDCCYIKKCSLKKTLAVALEAFFDSLAQKTLNDITPKKFQPLETERVKK